MSTFQKWYLEGSTSPNKEVMTLFSFFPISTHKIQDPQLQMGKIQNRLHEKNLNPPATYGGNPNTPATYGKIQTLHLHMGKNSNSSAT